MSLDDVPEEWWVWALIVLAILAYLVLLDLIARWFRNRW